MQITFTASAEGDAVILMEHVKSWERADPSADRGFSRLMLHVS